MNVMHIMYDEATAASARRLLDEVPAMRCKLGYISQAIQSDAGRPPLRPDPAQGCADEGSDIGGCESAGVKA